MKTLVTLTWEQYQSYVSLGKQYYVRGRLGKLYNLLWNNMFVRVNHYYWYINNNYMPFAPDIKDNNLLPPINPKFVINILTKDLRFTATAPIQQECSLFIYASNQVSGGQYICRQFAGIKLIPFNADVDINLYDDWYKWYMGTLWFHQKIFLKMIVVGNNNGFSSESAFIWGSTSD
jgi:hypothetical protein